MISFKQFLTDDIKRGATFTPIDVDAAISFLRTHAKDAIKAISTGSIIYRGFGTTDISSKAFWTIVDSTDMHRTSRDTNNAYQLMMDHSNALKGFPSRSSSIICTTSYETAESYILGARKPHVIMPMNGTVLAVSNKSDFITTRMAPYVRSVDTLTGVLGDMFRFLNAPKNEQEWSFEDFDAIAKTLDKYSPEIIALVLSWKLDYQFDFREDSTPEIRKLVELFTNPTTINASPSMLQDLTAAIASGEITIGARVIPLYKKFREARGGYLQIIADYYFTPKLLELKTMTFGSALPKEPVEMWFTGKCIAIPFDAFCELVEQLQSEGLHADADLLNTIDRYGPTRKKQNDDFF